MKRKADCSASLAWFDLFSGRVRLRFGEVLGVSSCCSISLSLLFLVAAAATAFLYLRCFLDTSFESIFAEQLVPAVTPEIVVDHKSPAFRLLFYHEDRGSLPLDLEDLERFVHPTAFYLPPDGSHKQDTRQRPQTRLDLVPCSSLEDFDSWADSSPSETLPRDADRVLEKALCLDSRKSELRLGGQLLMHFQGSLSVHLLPCSLDKKECADASEVAKLRVVFSLQNALPNFSNNMSPMTITSDLSNQVPLNLQFASEHFLSLQRTEVFGNGLFFSSLGETDRYTRILSKRFSLAYRKQDNASGPSVPGAQGSSAESYFSLYLEASSQLMRVSRRSSTFVQCFRAMLIDLALIFTLVRWLVRLSERTATKEALLSHVFAVDSPSQALYQAACDKLAEGLDAVSLLRDLAALKFLVDNLVSEDAKPASVHELLQKKVDLFRSAPAGPRPGADETARDGPHFAAQDGGQPSPFRPKRLGRIFNSSRPAGKPVLRGPLPKAVNYSIEVPHSGRSSTLGNIL